MPHLPFLSQSSSSTHWFCSSSASPSELPKPSSSNSSSSSAIPRCEFFRTAGCGGNASFNGIFSEVPSANSSSPPSSSSSMHSSLLTSFQFPSSVFAASIAPSSSPPILYFASGPDVSVLDLSSLRPISSFSSPSPVKSLAFSPTRHDVYTAHGDRRVRVWSASPDRLQHRLRSSLPTPSDVLRRSPLPANYIQVRRHHRLLWIRHADVVSSLAAAGDLLLSASWDKTVKVWRAAAGFRCVGSVAAHDDAVNAVVAAPDAATVYTASADRRVRAWSAEGGSTGGGGRRRLSPVATLERHRAAVNALALSADGSVLYSGGGDRWVVAWERGGGHREAAAVLRGHARAVMCLAAVGDDLVVSGSTDRTVRIWRRSEGYRCVAVLEGHRNGVRSVAACRVGSTGAVTEYRVCSGSVDGEVRVWGLKLI